MTAHVRLLLLSLLLLGLHALVPAAALGHAGLSESTPSEDAVVETPPAEVELRFTAPVSAQLDGAVKVFGPNDTRAENGAPVMSADGMVLTQPVTATEPGTYALAYRVTSDDGHNITGTLVFHVGEKSTGGDSAAQRSKADVEIDPALQVAFGVSRFFVLFLLLTVVGGGLFASIFAPAWPPRLLVGGLLALLVAIAASMVLNSAIAHDIAVIKAAAPGNLGKMIDTPFGSATLVTMGLAVLALAPAAVLRPGAARLSIPARVAMALVFCGLAASLSLTGHAAVTDPVAVRLPMDIVHVIAASIWIGGLVQLFLMSPVAGEHIPDIKRFSNAAFASVMVLLVTGVVATVIEVGLSPKELVESQYGRLILAKLLLYGGTMPLAYMNKSLYVPTIERRPEHATHLLRQYVYRELFLVTTVVALTAWLVGSDPEM